jgi:hypothetical protein
LVAASLRAVVPSRGCYAGAGEGAFPVLSGALQLALPVPDVSRLQFARCD